jgi:DNA-binding NtrC family response regulator
MNIHVVLIDDDEQYREDLATWLRRVGFTCTTAPDGRSGLQVAERESPDVVLCDLHMPDLQGVEVLDRIATSCAQTSVILVTGFGSLETAIDAFRRGAADYLLKPVRPEDLEHKIRRCAENKRLSREVQNLRRELSDSGHSVRVVGCSPAMQAVRKLIERVAPSESPVLITGESGTGKEVVARAIHDSGPRRDEPFVAVNAAAVPRELFESELFGHSRGAFTGASRDKPGFFELADGGTLFLDEIGEIPRELQPKLLRAIEQREVRRVGSTHLRRTNFRVLAATNRVLTEEIDAGRFRSDLYFRIRVVEVALPPLRERREDIPPLTEHLIRRLNARLKRRVPGVDAEAMRVLMSARWVGNVRRLGVNPSTLYRRLKELGP